MKEEWNICILCPLQKKEDKSKVEMTGGTFVNFLTVKWFQQRDSLCCSFLHILSKMIDDYERNEHWSSKIIYRKSNLSRETKVSLRNEPVLPVLLYGAESLF